MGDPFAGNPRYKRDYDEPQKKSPDYRTPPQRDHDRVLYSSAFRFPTLFSPTKDVIRLDKGISTSPKPLNPTIFTALTLSAVTCYRLSNA